jgi:hypothetical protein
MPRQNVRLSPTPVIPTGTDQREAMIRGVEGPAVGHLAASDQYLEGVAYLSPACLNVADDNTRIGLTR